MKRSIFVLLLCFCLVFAISCGSEDGSVNSAALDEGVVKSIEVSSMPHGYEYSFEGNDAHAVIDYIRGLHLEADFSEDPDVYTGMTWVVDIRYEDGTDTTVYMFGNMFIRKDNENWLKMDYNEAAAFEELLENLDK